MLTPLLRPDAPDAWLFAMRRRGRGCWATASYRRAITRAMERRNNRIRGLNRRAARGKTLIFADNDLPHTSHADQLVDLAVDVFGCGQSFVRKITGTVDRPLQAIREFRNRPTTGRPPPSSS